MGKTQAKNEKRRLKRLRNRNNQLENKLEIIPSNSPKSQEVTNPITIHTPTVSSSNTISTLQNTNSIPIHTLTVSSSNTISPIKNTNSIPIYTQVSSKIISPQQNTNPFPIRKSPVSSCNITLPQQNCPSPQANTTPDELDGLETLLDERYNQQTLWLLKHPHPELIIETHSTTSTLQAPTSPSEKLNTSYDNTIPCKIYYEKNELKLLKHIEKKSKNIIHHNVEIGKLMFSLNNLKIDSSTKVKKLITNPFYGYSFPTSIKISKPKNVKKSNKKLLKVTNKIKENQAKQKLLDKETVRTIKLTDSHNNKLKPNLKGKVDKKAKTKKNNSYMSKFKKGKFVELENQMNEISNHLNCKNIQNLEEIQQKLNQCQSIINNLLFY